MIAHNYRPQLRTRLRLSYGLRWKRNFPDMPSIKDVLLFVLVAILVCVALKYSAHLEVIAQAREEIVNLDQEQKNVARLLGCINGENALVAEYPDHIEFTFCDTRTVTRKKST